MKESKTAVNYRAKVEKVESEFCVKDKVFLRTTDNEATMRAAFTDLLFWIVLTILLN